MSTKPPSPKKPRAAAKKTPAASAVPYVALKDWVPPPRKPSPNELKFGDPALRNSVWDRVLTSLEQGLSLNKACAAIPEGVDPATILKWSMTSDINSQQYATARTIGYNVMAEDVADISDKVLLGVRQQTKAIFDKDGNEVKEAREVTTTREDQLGHRRLQVDTRKWLLSKCLPKIYGDRTAVVAETNDTLAASLADIASRLPV